METRQTNDSVRGRLPRERLRRKAAKDARRGGPGAPRGVKVRSTEQIEQLPDLQGFLKFASKQEWQRVNLHYANDRGLR